MNQAFKDIDSAFAYIESFTNLEKKSEVSLRDFKLEKMKILLSLFGNPEKSFKAIHIAGSKGKGSTGAFTAGILSELGFKTGLYSSPHVSFYTERIRIIDHEIDEKIFIQKINIIKNKIDENIKKISKKYGRVTTFELLTLLGFLIFKHEKCDWAVIETGLGGRFDATNILLPELCILTIIEKEHTKILGNTLTKIAREKAGIIKSNVPVVSGTQDKNVRSVFSSHAMEKKAELFFYENEVIKPKFSVKKNGTAISFKIKIQGRIHKFKTCLKMYGFHQAVNAVLSVISLTKIKELKITSRAVKNGLRKMILPGRFEILKIRKNNIIIDGAHTPSSVKVVLQTYKTLYKKQGFLIFGCLGDKNARMMADILAKSFKHIIITTPGFFKKSNPQKVFNIFSNINRRTKLILNPADALDYALKNNSKNAPILVTGSFYLIGEIRKILIQNK